MLFPFTVTHLDQGHLRGFSGHVYVHERLEREKKMRRMTAYETSNLTAAQYEALCFASYGNKSRLTHFSPPLTSTCQHLILRFHSVITLYNRNIQKYQQDHGDFTSCFY